MKTALSTNWCNRRIDKGEAIVEKAMELGFEALELGFHTSDAQAAEIVKYGKLPIGSVHAFCPVPISAPCGYPELYQIADFDEETRAMARFQIIKNVRFASSVGADALVLHSGRIRRGGFFGRRRSRKMMEIFRREMERIVPELEKNKVRLGLENMPYPEGFPDASEIEGVIGEWVRPWFDTGHAHVMKVPAPTMELLGVHVNDSRGGDDHLPPGEGQIDFKALKPLFEKTPHVVFEPNEGVSEAALRKGLDYIRGL